MSKFFQVSILAVILASSVMSQSPYAVYTPQTCANGKCSSAQPLPQVQLNYQVAPVSHFVQQPTVVSAPAPIVYYQSPYTYVQPTVQYQYIYHQPVCVSRCHCR